MEGLILAVGALLVVPGMIAASAILNGYVLSVLWGGFIVPVFHVPVLSIPYAIGLALVVGFLTYQHIDCKSKNSSEESDGKVIVKAVSMVLFRPLFSLFMGWIVHQFV